MKKNITEEFIGFFYALALLILLFFPRIVLGQTFGTDFESYSTNDLYLNGWDFTAGNFTISVGDTDFGRNLKSGNLPISTSTPLIVNSGYWNDTGTSDRAISFNWKAVWGGSITRRGEWRLLIYNLNNVLLGSSAWITATTSGAVEFSGFVIPSGLFTGQGWYYFAIEARRTGTNSGGTSRLRFDNFSSTFPTNSDWPELSPNVSVTDNFIVSDNEINEGDQAQVTFDFEYNEVLPSPSQRAVRGLQYQITLHDSLAYVAHSITGASAGPSSTYDPLTGIFTIEAIQKTQSLTLEITVEGIGECIGCEVEIEALNANEPQPKTGFGDDIEILSVLPIELIYFRAEALPTQKAVRLDWATATELENDFFTIERSRDGLNFYPIAEVPGAGTHSGILEYSFKDITALEGTSYYRLKQTDFNARGFSYSEVIRVQLPFNARDVSIYPNPVKTNQLVQLAMQGNWDELQTIDVQVISQNGQIIATTEQHLSQERTLVLDKLPALSPGIYLIKITQDLFRIVKRLIIEP